jgi:hypothetical protein
MDLSDNIKVLVRVRPTNQKEINEGVKYNIYSKSLI